MTAHTVTSCPVALLGSGCEWQSGICCHHLHRWNCVQGVVGVCCTSTWVPAGWAGRAHKRAHLRSCGVHAVAVDSSNLHHLRSSCISCSSAESTCSLEMLCVLSYRRAALLPQQCGCVGMCVVVVVGPTVHVWGPPQGLQPGGAHS